MTESSVPLKATPTNKRKSYTISITCTTVWEKTTTENMIVSKEPTEIKEPKHSSYHGSNEGVAYKETYAPVTKVQTVSDKVAMYEQTVDDLNLVAVINAVNAQVSS